MKHLLTKHKLFIFEYLKEPSCLVSAMRRAGYKGTSHKLEDKARDILSHPDAESLLGQFFGDEGTKEKIKLTVEGVIEDLELAKSYALTPYRDAQGNERRDLGIYVKSVELQGKHLKMFADRVHIESDAHIELVKLIKMRQGHDE